VGPAKATSTAGAAVGAATETGSAFTKCRKAWFVQVLATGAERLQQPCGAFSARESSNWGQEKQFPQNSATTTNAASSALETVFIKQ
jgi:hypothetical protein